MKDKDTISTEQIESINSDIFRSFDPESETWIVGGSKTITGGLTATPEGMDGWADMDFTFDETRPQT